MRYTCSRPSKVRARETGTTSITVEVVPAALAAPDYGVQGGAAANAVAHAAARAAQQRAALAIRLRGTLDERRAEAFISRMFEQDHSWTR